jgi:2-hydroxymuconate-semialdehyde hydrolase
MLDGLPVRKRSIEPAGVRTALLEAGDGPPLVLLHGAIECGGAVWAPVVPRLAERHRVVIPDLPGLGESGPVARLDFPAWLAALLDGTCDAPPALVAHSLGGSLAAGFAARHGDRLARLVIYAAPGVGRFRMPLGLRAAGARFAVRPSRANAERIDRRAFHDVDRMRRRDPEWLEAFDAYRVARGRVPHVRRTMGRLIRSGTRRVPERELRRIDVPTTLLWGRHDRFVPLGLGEAASARLGWPLRVVEDAGHVPHIEQTDRFLEALT